MKKNGISALIQDMLQINILHDLIKFGQYFRIMQRQNFILFFNIILLYTIYKYVIFVS